MNIKSGNDQSEVSHPIQTKHEIGSIATTLNTKSTYM